MTLHIFCDGGARGNPGPAALGVVIKENNGKLITEFGKILGVQTNNFAEYSAVLAALNWVGEHLKEKPSAIEFYLDSLLVVSQMNGIWKIKNDAIRNLVMKVRIAEREVGGNISYTHVRRENNKEADAQVNKALDNELGN
jgi:ribonuclease HI